MLFLKLLHFLSGYLRFEASEGFPERFMNLCASMRIPIWDVFAKDGSLIGKTKIQSYLSLHRAAKKAGMHLRILRKCGLPFIINRNRKRMGLLPGLVLCIGLLAFLSSFLWSIKIEGNHRIPEEKILAVLSKGGIREGMRTKDINVTKAEQYLFLQMPDVAWITLNRHGSVLHVQLREKIQTRPPQDFENPCHIVASRDGFLTELRAYEGSAAVPVNTAVTKGQLLISGITENADGSSLLHHAKGLAVAETTRKIETTIPRATVYPFVRRTARHVTLCLFHLRIPFGVPENTGNAMTFRYENRVMAGQMRLPIVADVQRRIVFEGTRNLCADEVKLLCLSEYSETVCETLYGCQILAEEVDISENGKALRVCGKLRLLENIGIPEEIRMEETSE